MKVSFWLKKILLILIKSDKQKASESPLISSSITQPSTKENLNNAQKKMNKCTLKRVIRSNKATLGILYLKDKEIARTLENPYLDNRPLISCIPEGEYKCIRDRTGKFQWWKVLDVERRVNIEIHQGNTEKDTKGCPIVGERWGFLGEELAVLNSVKTLKKIEPLLGEEFILEVVNA